MKKSVLIFMTMVAWAYASSPIPFDTYLRAFDYKERTEMKIKTPDMLTLVEENKAILVDVRFKEEFDVWHIAGSINIPLNELPNRFLELPKDKLIITACPHNDRSNMARLFLTMQGYKAKYLNDGLLKTADFLRGENAKDYLEELKAHKEKK